MLELYIQTNTITNNAGTLLDITRGKAAAAETMLLSHRDGHGQREALSSTLKHVETQRTHSCQEQFHRF